MNESWQFSIWRADFKPGLAESLAHYKERKLLLCGKESLHGNRILLGTRIKSLFTSLLQNFILFIDILAPTFPTGYFITSEYPWPTAVCCCCCLVTSVVSGSVQPYEPQPASLLCLRDSLGKNTRVGSHAHLRGIFPTQGLNPSLLHCRQILYRWATREVHSSLPGPKPALGSFGSDLKAHYRVLSQFPDSKWLNYHLTTSKVTLKILQARLQQYVNHELPDVQDGFRKGKGTRE